MKAPDMPLAYSYLRFSSPQQAAGDSIRRQTEATAEWCQRNAATLDTSLRLRDEGVSAFRGRNRENPDVHGLAAFLAAVKSGRVPADSYLILENLDRLTREQIVPAVNLFTGLLLAGVRIVQLRPAEQVYTSGADMSAIMLAIVELSRGHSESAMKSQRVGAAWANKRRNAATRIVTRRVPGWLRVEGDRFALDRDNVEAVRQVYALARAGLGSQAIAQKLNADRVPTIGGRSVPWRPSTVSHLLLSRAVLGEFQPHTLRGGQRKPDGEPIPNYFPAIIAADEWHATRAAVASRKACGRGRRGRHVNLFGGLLVEALSGESLTYNHDAERSRLRPSGRCDAYTAFPADVFETAVMSMLSEVKASDLDAAGSDAGRKVEALAGRVAELDALIRKWSAKMDNPDTVDMVEAKLAEYGRKKKTLAGELAAAQREAASPLSEAWGQFRGLAELLAADRSDELRLKVRAALRRTVETVAVLIVRGRFRHDRLAFVQVWFHGGARRDYVIAYRGALPFQAATGAEKWEARSATADELAGGLDLRKRSDAAKLSRILERDAACVRQVVKN